MRKMYLVLSNKELEDALTVKQFDFLYLNDDSRHYKKERAIEKAKAWTKKFNERFETNYTWDYLYSIDEEYFTNDGCRY